MLGIFGVLFLTTLAATLAGYGLGRRATADERRRLPVLVMRLHRATRTLHAAVTAMRSPR